MLCQPHIPQINSIWSQCFTLPYILLNIVFLYFIKDIWVCVNEGYWPIILFSLGIFVRSGLRIILASLHELGFTPSIFKSLYKIGIISFLNVIEFTSEAIWSCNFLGKNIFFFVATVMNLISVIVMGLLFILIFCFLLSVLANCVLLVHLISVVKFIAWSCSYCSLVIFSLFSESVMMVLLMKHLLCACHCFIYIDYFIRFDLVLFRSCLFVFNHSMIIHITTNF